MSKLYLIAELGVNFYDTAKKLNISPLDAAKMYIDKAYDAGIDCVKFQAYKAGKLASVHSPAYWDTTKEPTLSQYELFQKFDSFGEEEYRILSEYAHLKGMEYMVTPFDDEAVDYLAPLVDVFKISSSDITNIPFISHIGSKAKPVMISAGASDLGEVDAALAALRGSGCRNITIMHCVLSYPTLQENANLKIIETLAKRYPDCRIGYSDHVAPDENMLTLTTAYVLGAHVIEKHFTLDKSLTGNDHYHAGDPDDFKKARMNIDMVDKMLGSPEKHVLPCEEMSRRQARRSLVFTHDMKKGEVIKECDVTAKRPGTGVSPSRIFEVIGKKTARNVNEDDIMTDDMVE